jgi:beta-glucanase (GH16 family)
MNPTSKSRLRPAPRPRRWLLAPLALLVLATGCESLADGDALTSGSASKLSTVGTEPKRTTTSTTSTSTTTTTALATTTGAPTTAAPATTGPATTARPRPRATTTVAPAPPPTDPPAAELPPTTPAPPPPPSEAPAPEGWHTVFADEFNGGGIDGSKWTVCGECRAGHGEVNSDNQNRVSVGDGLMRIRALRNDSSSWVWTYNTFQFKHGKVEIRAQMPKGQGVWPALWMLPKQEEWPPEIDIYESINNEGRYFVNYHYNGGGGNRQYHPDGPHPVNTDTTQWHTYGVEWSPGLLVFTLDGQEVGRATQGVDQLDAARPMYLIMNVAMGGDWAGSPDGSTPEVNDMLVDWVRVYQR